MRRLRESLWIGPAAAALFAVAINLSAYLIGTRYDATVAISISEDTMVTVLTLFASGMLTVATFSVSAMAASASSVAESTTPRAAVHVITDARGRVALTSFIAAFVYSVVGVLALVALDFGEVGRLALFLGLILIVAIVLVAFISWVDHVLTLGRQQHALARLLHNALTSVTRDSAFALGARPWDGTVPSTAAPVHHTDVGRVITISTRRAQQLADEHGVEIIVALRPGATCDPTRPFAYVVGERAPEVAESLAKPLRRVIELDPFRTQDQDVRFNLTLLGETADRALSPGVNDPGTAIVVLDLLLAFFAHWCDVRRDAVSAEVRAPQVRVPVLEPEALVRDAFGPIARDGAGFVEVGIRLQKALAALTRMRDPELAAAAVEMSRRALTFARRELPLDDERFAVEAVAPPAALAATK